MAGTAKKMIFLVCLLNLGIMACADIPGALAKMSEAPLNSDVRMMQLDVSARHIMETYANMEAKTTTETYTFTKIADPGLTWLQSKAACEDIGMRLPVITSAEKQQALKAYCIAEIPPQGSGLYWDLCCWLGLYCGSPDAPTPGCGTSADRYAGWTWLDGSTLSGGFTTNTYSGFYDNSTWDVGIVYHPVEFEAYDSNTLYFSTLCEPGSTASTTASPTTSAAQNPSAKGDPHMQNILGQRFDLMQPGSHALMNIPRGTPPQEDALFRVTARADHLGGNCADMYFQALNVTGQWVEATALGLGGLRFSAGSDDADYAGSVNDNHMARWLTFGPIDLKVVRGHLPDGNAYLNVLLKNIKNAGYPVGGLLGEDDHQKEATPSAQCKYLAELRAIPRVNVTTANKFGSVAQVLVE